MAVAQLLQEHFHLFKPEQGTILDLACGVGQNGLYLKDNDLAVMFADVQQQHLSNLAALPNSATTETWCADFESESQLDAIKLSAMQLQGVIVFRYLHRPLFEHIKQAIKPGGILIYETFTELNKQFGRPHREQFLLKTGELKSIFKDWQEIYYFEGIKHDPDRAIAQIVCKKPV
ncbi:tellurite resistance protein [Psychromonas sp.]|nr:tellurite resistance protein [Psychromonas sp.]